MRQRSGLLPQKLQRLAYHYPFLRRITLTTSIIILSWFYIFHWGERKIFQEHIEACDWESWEQWPRGVQPHRAALIADPQLVDPHTYPSRPWPLSSMTETYTDLYMSRNFRLINARLDPDSIVMLGDLFDGGREWATSQSRKLTWQERSQLVDYGIVLKDEPEEPERQSIKKRSLESYRMALAKAAGKEVPREDHAMGADGRDLKKFKYGENAHGVYAKWRKYSDKQWKKELRRFSKIFWAPNQLYPTPQRNLYPVSETAVEQLAVDNGAANRTWTHYGTAGGKQRLFFSSLPGNHDLGMGTGIQWSVRDRFEAHFGESNQLYILGNHTFVSLDTPSLSASSQWHKEGGETTLEHLMNYTHVWRPAKEFIDGLHDSAGRRVADHLHSMYPRKTAHGRRTHQVTAAKEAVPEPALTSVHNPPAQLPVVLLTHVPLFRMPDTPCGKLRERGNSIPFAFGYQYQNCLTQKLSREVITKVNGAGEIARVFSGDDHDYCDTVHKYNIGPWNAEIGAEGVKTTLMHIRETTVKSFSWAMGVRKPGFQLVSLWNPIDDQGETIGTPIPTLQTHLCLLPDQLSIFIRYAMYLGLTFFILVFRATILSLRSQRDYDSASSLTSSPYFSDSSQPRWDLPTKLRRSDDSGDDPSRRPESPSKRNRAASFSTSTDHLLNSSSGGVQRSANARARSISPADGPSSSSASSAAAAAAEFKPRPGSLVEKAGFHPKVAWNDPGDADSDEESRVGSGEWDSDERYDKGLKWKHSTQRGNHLLKGKGKGKGKGKLARFWEELRLSLFVVFVPCALWYTWLIQTG